MIFRGFWMNDGFSDKTCTFILLELLGIGWRNCWNWWSGWMKLPFVLLYCVSQGSTYCFDKQPSSFYSGLFRYSKEFLLPCSFESISLVVKSVSDVTQSLLFAIDDWWIYLPTTFHYFNIILRRLGVDIFDPTYALLSQLSSIL